MDGEKIPERNSEAVYIVLNKPVGITCTAAEHVEGNIIQYVNYSSRILQSADWIKRRRD